MKFKTYAYYFKNEEQIKLYGMSHDSFEEAKEEAIALEKEMDAKHVDIFHRTPVTVRNTETEEEWQLDVHDGDYEGAEFSLCPCQW